ncbi:MAG TPA: YfhO family protein [Solirubrobacteraceae bacterium]
MKSPPADPPGASGPRPGPRPARRLLGRPAALITRVRRRDAAVVVGLLALGLLLVYPAVLGGRVLAPEDILLFSPPLQSLRPDSLIRPANYLLTDSVVVFHPDLAWVRGVLRSGHLPLWDPDTLTGEPLLASQQTAMLFPLTLLAYVLPFWSSLGVIVVLKVLLAGLGTWWVCRTLGLRPASAWLAAITYGLGTYFVVWLDHPQTNVWLLVPWLLLAVRRVARRGDPRGVALLAAAVGLALLGGHPESVFLVGLLVAAFAANELAGRGASAWLAGSRRAVLVRLLAAAGLGVLCGLVVVIPFIEQLGQSVNPARGGTNLPQRALLSLFMPDFWGRPDSAFSGNGPVDYAERTLYIGALPLLLALAGLHRSMRREQRFFLFALLGALVLAIHLPGLAGLPRLPVLNEVALARALVIASFSLAMLAAYGLESFLDGDPPHRRRMLLVGSLVGLVPVAAELVGRRGAGRLPRFADLAPSLWGHTVNQAQAQAGALTRWVLAAGLGLVLLLLLGRATRRGVLLALLLAWCAVDLLALDHGYQPAIPDALADPPPTPSILAARAAEGHGRVAGLGQYLISNVAERYGLRDVRGHELPVNRRFIDLFKGLRGTVAPGTLLFTNSKTGRLLNDLGASLFLTGPTRRPKLAQLRLVSATPDGRVYRNTTALPRAYLASSWTPVANRAAALSATLRATTDELRQAPVIETTNAPPTSPTGGRQPSTVRFEIDGADEVKLSVGSPTGGYLVLLDSYYPGWQATVDGHRVPIQAANEAFRGVRVPPGDHQVDFRYRPTSVLAGGLASLAGWLIVLLGLIARPGRPGRPPAGRRRPRPARSRRSRSEKSADTTPDGVRLIV